VQREPRRHPNPERHWLALVAFAARNWFWGWTFFVPGFARVLIGLSYQRSPGSSF